MEKRNSVRWLFEKYWNNTATEKETQRLRQWLIDHKEDPEAKKLFEEFEQMVDKDTLLAFNPPAGEEEKVLLQHIHNRIEKEEKDLETELHQFRPDRFKWLIAATVSLVAGVLISLLYFSNQPLTGATMLTQQVSRGEKASFKLPDGTRVQMNSESTITYPEKFDDDMRQVVLTGEAFFEVVRNEQKPFIVKTGDITTQVLGTSFNVKAYEDDLIAVTVTSGKVQVNYTPSDSSSGGVPAYPLAQTGMVLIPNDQAIFNSTSGLEKLTVDASNYNAWKDGVLKFEEARFEDAVEELERWYGIDIEVDPRAANCRITAEYTGEKLRVILRNFELLMGISYQFIDEKVMIKGAGCGQI